MRLIDVSKLVYRVAVDDNDGQIFYVPAEEIDNAPTIDAEPVRHGHWIENHYVFYVFGENYQPALNVEIDYKCSICNEDNEKTTDYCPNCGAKMDEVSE